MSIKFKAAEVSMSFHYLVRRELNDGVYKSVPITFAELEEVFLKLSSSTNVDLKQEDNLSRVQLRQLLPMEKVERVDQRTICGVFKNSYWGHAIENSKYGELPADSINLRPFFFFYFT